MSLAELFSRLGFDDDIQQEYITSLASEDDRVEAVLGLVEGQEEDDARPAVEELLRAIDAANQQRLESAPVAKPSPVKAVIRVPSPEPTAAARTRQLTEEERLQREKLLRQYDHVEETANEQPELAPAGVTARPAKGKARAVDDELFVNDNAAQVRAAEVAKREASAKQAMAKKIKDKEDLVKQRADVAKRKEEARKKSARAERKA